MSDISRPEIISRFKKQRFLQAMSEDRFRDEVVRPLFLRQGFGDGRDLCGPFEKGKDALFVATDKLGIEDVYVIQTKAGNINLARKASANVVGYHPTENRFPNQGYSAEKQEVTTTSQSDPLRKRNY